MELFSEPGRGTENNKYDSNNILARERVGKVRKFPPINYYEFMKPENTRFQ